MQISGVALSLIHQRCVGLPLVQIEPVAQLLLFQEQEAIYSLLVSLQSEMLSRLKDGVIAKDMYQHALAYVRERKPELEARFAKNIGHGVSVCVL